jgi:hypothetical protein
MRRLLLLALCLVAVSSAAAADGQPVRGRILVLTDKAVVVKSDRGATACARADSSPSLDGYAVGDPVALLCTRSHGRLVLVKAQHVTAAPVGDTQPVTFGGTITALSPTSISLHDGNRDLTCSIGDTSPSTGDLEVGQHVKVACVGGVLAKLAPVTAAPQPQPQPPAPAPEAKTAAGNITALSATSLSIHNDEHGGFDVTCTLGASSPALGDYKLGDRVGIACVNGVLAKIVKITR